MNDDLYGTDLMMTIDGDFEATTGGDLATITGLANLQQANENRLLTTPNEYLFGPYGCTLKQYVDAVMVSTSLQLQASQDVIAALMQDDRNANVQSVSVFKNSSGELDTQVTITTAFGDTTGLGVNS